MALRDDNGAASAFSHLRLHSEFDINKGVARISGKDSVIDCAAALRQPALALTDHGNIFGAIKFYRRCREKGVKPIIGCEVKVDAHNDHHLLLLCANHAGYVNLNRLLTRMYSENSCLQAQWLNAESTAGIIALSAERRGDIGMAIAGGQLEAAERYARNWQERFPDRFYIEVWRNEQEDNNHAAAACDIGQRLGLPIAATHPVQCTHREDKEILDIKLCIAAGTRIYDSKRPQALSPHPHLLDAEEMQKRFADMPGAIDNSIEIAKRCNLVFELGKRHFPSLPQKARQSSAELLQQEAEQGLEKKLLQTMTITEEKKQEYTERLHYELGVINTMEFSDYFLIVMDFIRWAKEQDIPVGPGRGSGAGSLVAYALDITTLDPIHYELLFERFLNPERVSMPDFDIDFCVNGRDKVIQYVEERYGKDCVAQIVTFGTIGAKGAVRDVGRVLGIPYGYCDKLARMIPNTPKITLNKALSESTDFAQEHRNEEGKRLIDLALKVEGLPRNVGTHAGGVLIAPRAMELFCPKYAAADTNTLVSQYDMGDIERVGLVKFDFLGLRTLTILADAQCAVQHHDSEFSLEAIPLDDDATYEMYSSGHSIGVFQCESLGMRELMRQLKPDRFTDLIALVALYRPGPLGAGMNTSYISRKHKREKVSYPHEKLTSVLADTYGLFIYQEQVMEIARRISGYSLSEADILRRAMGKKDEKEMKSMRERFIQGSGEHISPAAAEKLFDDMAQFAEYGFNKSHAAAYAMLSYRTAYLKAHYPAIFLSAVLSAEADNTDRVQLLIKDAKRLKITILAPDINQSNGNFYAVDKNTIRYGLRAIKGIGEGVINTIVEARGDQAFANLFDFCARVAGGVPAAALELLIQAGAFDSLHENRAAVHLTAPSALAQNFNVGNLFAGTAENEQLAQAPHWSLREKLACEHHALGFPLSGNYYQIYEQILPALSLTQKQLKDINAGDSVLLAGIFSRMGRFPRGNNKVLVLHDGESEIEVSIPPALVKVLDSGSINSELLMVRGQAASGFRQHIAVTARDIMPLDEFLAHYLRGIMLHCDDTFNAAEAQELLSSPQHKHEIILRYTNGALHCDITLGKQCLLNYALYQRLKKTLGVREINLAFEKPKPAHGAPVSRHG